MGRKKKKNNKIEHAEKLVMGPKEPDDTRDSFLDKLWHQVFHKYSGLEIFLLCATLTMFIITVVALNLVGRKNDRIEEQDRIIETLGNQSADNLSQLESLQSQLDEANNQVQLVSESLNSKTQEVETLIEGEKLSRIPSAYPLKGTAAIYSEDENMPQNNDDDDNLDEQDEVDEMAETYGDKDTPEDEIPTTYFMTGADTRVIATGFGKVNSITEDPDYGYCIEIDHENGYVTTYKGFGVALVNEGDLVMQGCDIMHIVDENRMFQYRICYNGEYIDPMTCMEING